MAKEKPFHTSTYRAGDAPKQSFFAVPDAAGNDALANDRGDGGDDVDMPRRDAPQAQAPSPRAIPASEWTGDFVSRITHDLMNALSAATSFGELVLEDLSPDDPRRQHAEKALQGCALALRLVKMLRDPAQWRGREESYLDLARSALRGVPPVERRLEPAALLHNASSDAPTDETPAEDAASPAASHESLRILVIDGRSAVADGLSQGFDLLGHKAFPVYDPQEALNLFYETSGEWDAVICPVILRGQGGAGLLQKIKGADERVLTVLTTGAAAPPEFSPVGCDLVVESAAGAAKIAVLLSQHLARAGLRPRVRVVA